MSSLALTLSPPTIGRKRSAMMHHETMHNLSVFATPLATSGKRLRLLEVPATPRHLNMEPLPFFSEPEEEVWMPSLMDDAPNRSPLLEAPRPVRLKPRLSLGSSSHNSIPTPKGKASRRDNKENTRHRVPRPAFHKYKCKSMALTPKPPQLMLTRLRSRTGAIKRAEDGSG